MSGADDEAVLADDRPSGDPDDVGDLGAEDASDDAPAPSGAHDDTGSPPDTDRSLDIETLIDDLDRVTGERDGHLGDLQRVSAEFANFRRQNEKRQHDVVQQAAARLAEALLPVLDACEAASLQGVDGIEPIKDQLLGVLEREGLEVVRAADDPFDPNRHEAVMHELADEGQSESIVAEVLRTGYVWNGKVLRPAMVRVRG